MGFGKMNTQIDIISVVPVKDADGFATYGDTVLATVMAYKENKYGSKRWANMAAFSEATAMFRFRKIPGLAVTTAMAITDGATRFDIISAEDVRGRGLYVEVMAKEVSPSGKS